MNKLTKYETFVSFFIQFGLVICFHIIFYKIALLFHEPTYNDWCIFCVVPLLELYFFSFITVGLLNNIMFIFKLDKIISLIIHSIGIAILGFFFIDEFKYQPYEIGLLYFCVSLTIFTKIIIDYYIFKRRKN